MIQCQKKTNQLNINVLYTLQRDSKGDKWTD
jgi:hypothetical protein